MLLTPHARFARLFLRATSTQAGAIDAIQQAQTLQQVLNPPPSGPAPKINTGIAVTPTVNPPPPPNAPRPPPLEPVPRSGEAPATGLAGMSTTTKVVIGVAAFGAVYLLLRSRGG